MFKKIANDFFVDFDKSQIENLPELMHRYGQPYPVSDEIHWMSYERSLASPDAAFGSISFSTHTFKFMPEFTNNVIEKLKEKFGIKIKWNHQRVRILRTKGSILPHVDEVRNSCINIGLINSNAAITHFGKNNELTDFDSTPFNTETYICQDGEAYLLNVKNFHAVYPAIETDAFRYLITYGFEEDFNTLLNNVTL